MPPALLLLAVALFSAVGRAAFPANNQRGANVWSARLRRDIKSQQDWDPVVPPTSDRSPTGTAGEAGHYSDSGTDVRMQIRFFKVESVDAAAGAMRVKVWFRLSWNDERLAWNPELYGGLTETYFHGKDNTDSQDSEIWLPDLQRARPKFNEPPLCLDELFGTNQTHKSVARDLDSRKRLPPQLTMSSKALCTPSNPRLHASIRVAPSSGADRAVWTSCANLAGWSPFPLTPSRAG